MPVRPLQGSCAVPMLAPVHPAGRTLSPCMDHTRPPRLSRALGRCFRLLRGGGMGALLRTCSLPLPLPSPHKPRPGAPPGRCAPIAWQRRSQQTAGACTASPAKSRPPLAAPVRGRAGAGQPRGRRVRGQARRGARGLRGPRCYQRPEQYGPRERVQQTLQQQLRQARLACGAHAAAREWGAAGPAQAQPGAQRRAARRGADSVQPLRQRAGGCGAPCARAPGCVRAARGAC